MLFDSIDITDIPESRSIIDNVRLQVQIGPIAKNLDGSELIQIDQHLIKRKEVILLKSKYPIEGIFYELLLIKNDELTDLYLLVYKEKEPNEKITNLNVTEHIWISDDNDHIEIYIRDIFLRDSKKEELSHIKIKYLEDKRYVLIDGNDLKIIGVFEDMDKIKEGNRLKKGIVDTNKFPSILDEELNNLFRCSKKFIDNKCKVSKDKKLILYDRYEKITLYIISIIDSMITNGWKDESNIGIIESLIYN